MSKTAAFGADIDLEGVTRRYSTDRAGAAIGVDSVTLTIPPGRVVAIAGPSGSGKSTLLHLIGAMDSPDAGVVRVGGVVVNRLTRKGQAAYRRSIGFVFQRFHLLPALTVLDNVVAPLLPYRTTFDKFARAKKLLAAVGLGERQRSLPSRLSGGEQQRVAIARALINNPGLLLADEPTGNLDSKTSSEVMQLLLDLREERGMTVIVATHDPLIASRCDRIVSLRDGRVADDMDVPQTVDPDEILGRIGRLGPGE